MKNYRRALMAAGLGAVLVGGGRAGIKAGAAGIRARRDPDLDPLYDLPDDVIHHEVPARDGGSIHVVERGQGRPLVLIHGITLQAGIWSPQLHLLADRYRVMAVDVRGHGRSSAGTDGYGRRVAAADVATVLEHFDLHDAVVVGHSMGGMILMEFAGEHREDLEKRVAGLVFMDTAAFALAPAPLLRPARALGKRALARLEAGRPVPQRRMGDDDLSWIFTRLAFGGRPSGRAVDETRRCGSEMEQAAVMACGVDLIDHDARRALVGLTTPCLILVGSRDLLTPVYAARRIAKLIPSARLEILPGAGHQLMQERPHEVGQLLDEFCATFANFAIR
jgi:pimeloyl-ACP methyl ester carboxylesterase